MNKVIENILSLMCFLPACLGIFKYKRIEKKLHPFIFMMILDFLIEFTFNSVLKFSVTRYFNQLIVNLYMLLNFSIFLYLVFINGFISKKLMLIFISISVPIAVFNAIYNGTILTTFFYLLSFVSTVMLFISIDILSKQILVINKRMTDNCWFWISSFSILYNGFTLLIFGLYFFSLFNTPDGRTTFIIHHFVNATCYVFFAIGIFKIPEKISTL